MLFSVHVHEKKLTLLQTAFFAMGNQITIFDVARLAGVSKGTVDRVLHNRGEVSSATEKKVREAIEELNYTTNVYASNLGFHGSRTFSFILPTSADGEYWHKLSNGAAIASSRLAPMNAIVKTYYFDQYDPSSFVRTCNEVLSAGPSGVVMVPLFLKESAVFASELTSRSIPYACIDTKSDDAGYLAYYGMDKYNSGVLCAALLTERLEVSEVKRVLIVRILRDMKGKSDPTAERRSGFSDFMCREFPDCVTDTVFINPSDSSDVKNVLETYFSEHPDVKLVVMFNSRVYLLGDYFLAHPDSGRRVVAFDDLDGNFDLLRKGGVTILICQRTEDQAVRSVAALADSVLMHSQPSKRDNYVHMEILTRYNIDNY